MTPIRYRHLLALGALTTVVAAIALAAPSAIHDPTLAALWKWTPVLLGGFGFNLIISALSMIIGTALGFGLGLGLIARRPLLRRLSGLVMNLFRNAPRLVLLFMCMFLIPFKFNLLGTTIPLPGWSKAVLGLSLAVMANVAEILRGAVQSVPTAQWESAESLAFSRFQSLWSIILPQCLKRMIPPWMSLYSIITMDTVLVSILGVSEVMTLTGEALGSENNDALLLPFYGYVLVWFFLYCYPISLWTARLERRYAVKN
jgi:polar amino acid transport system permease protein